MAGNRPTARDRRSMDMGTRDDAGGDVKAGPPTDEAGGRETDGRGRHGRETATRTQEEASSTETAERKDEAEQAKE